MTATLVPIKTSDRNGTKREAGQGDSAIELAVTVTDRYADGLEFQVLEVNSRGDLPRGALKNMTLPKLDPLKGVAIASESTLVTAVLATHCGLELVPWVALYDKKQRAGIVTAARYGNVEIEDLIEFDL